MKPVPEGLSFVSQKRELQARYKDLALEFNNKKAVAAILDKVIKSLGKTPEVEARGQAMIKHYRVVHKQQNKST